MNKMKLQQTKDYLLLIDEEAGIVPNKTLSLNLGGDTLLSYPFVPTKEVVKSAIKLAKIIAYYPQTEEAKELDLPLLPPFKDLALEFANEIKQDVSQYDNGRWYGRIEGYKAAQAKQFTIEDMEEAFKASYGTGKYGFDAFIQSLSTQQLPKEFIPEYEDINDYDDDDESGLLPILRLKTTANSKGKEVLVGEYKF